MRFVRPCPAYLPAYRMAIEEDERYRPLAARMFADPEHVIRRAYETEHGIDLPPGYVRATTLWLIDDGRFIGETGIRHELTPALLQYAGNIGYEIRCSEARRGYGTKMLGMALEFCRDQLRLDKVLLTCDDDNIGSIKVIENNGGVLENKVPNQTDRGPVLTRRYWIELPGVCPSDEGPKR